MLSNIKTLLNIALSSLFMQNEESLISEELLDEAQIAFKTYFKPEVRFERSIFLSWLTSKSSSDFSFTLLKRPIKNAQVARRSLTSVLAEAYLCKQLGWDVIVMNNYEVYKFDEFIEILKNVSNVYESKVAVGTIPLSRSELDIIKPYTSSIVASMETVNKDIHKRISSNKSIEPFLRMLGEAQDFDRGISITLGLGETLRGIKELHRFIETHSITRITLLPLIPEKGSKYLESPSSFYITRWIAETRLRFPSIRIIAGTWIDRAAEIGLFLKAGANDITKFPAIKFFNSEQSKIIEEECRNAGRKFLGTLTDAAYLKNIDKLDVEEDIKLKLNKYVSSIKKSK